MSLYMPYTKGSCVFCMNKLKINENVLVLLNCMHWSCYNCFVSKALEYIWPINCTICQQPSGQNNVAFHPSHSIPCHQCETEYMQVICIECQQFNLVCFRCQMAHHAHHRCSSINNYLPEVVKSLEEYLVDMKQLSATLKELFLKIKEKYNEILVNVEGNIIPIFYYNKNIFDVYLVHKLSSMFQNYLLHKLFKLKDMEHGLLKFKNRIDNVIDELTLLLTLDISIGHISSFSIVFREVEEIKSFDATTKANDLLTTYTNLNYQTISKQFFLATTNVLNYFITTNCFNDSRHWAKQMDRMFVLIIADCKILEALDNEERDTEDRSADTHPSSNVNNEGNHLEINFERQTDKRPNNNSCDGLLFVPVSKEWMANICDNFELYYNPATLSSVTKVHGKPLTTPYFTVQMLDDGNTFYRCISFWMSGHQNYHTNIRNFVWSAMSDTIEDVTGQGICASEIEIRATAMMLNKDILVYSFHNGAWKKYNKHPIDTFATKDDCIYICINKDNQHMVVINVY